MRPISSTTTQVDNIPGEEIAFSISPKNAAFVMRSMADLYSNRELAVIREYSTNARDAMIEAGKADEHISISLPSLMHPRFIVQDFGVGMSTAELREVYTQFGESTKRESDDYNGMLGFGSKSAVAYTNTFTVTSVKDGYKTVGIITRSEDKMGGYVITLKIVLQVATSEGNGTTIEIPVHNHAEFARKARDFYRFWIPGTVLVDGRQPEWAVGEKLDEGLYYSKAGDSFVVMGNVAYPIANPAALFPKGMNQISFVAYVDNGTVEFTPNREALKYSEHTKKNLHKVIEDFASTVVSKAKTEIAQAKTHWEAFNAWDRWTKVVGVKHVPDLYFRGEKLAEDAQITGQSYDSHLSRYATSAITRFPIRDVPNALFITEFINNLGSDHKSKAREYAQMHKLSPRYYVFTTGKIASPWIDPQRVVRWEDLKAALPPRPKKARAQSVPTGRRAGTFDLVTAKGVKSEQDVPDTKELYFVTVQEYNTERDLAAVLAEFVMTHEVVKVPANRYDKFMRFYPHAKPIWPMLESKVVLDGESLLSPDARAYFNHEINSLRLLSKLQANRVDDPALQEAIRLCATPENTYLADYNKHMRLARVLGLHHKFTEFRPIRHRYERKVNVFKDYPLASANNLSHTYVYINAVYAARKSGKFV